MSQNNTDRPKRPSMSSAGNARDDSRGYRAIGGAIRSCGWRPGPVRRATGGDRRTALHDDPGADRGFPSPESRQHRMGTAKSRLISSLPIRQDEVEIRPMNDPAASCGECARRDSTRASPSVYGFHAARRKPVFLRIRVLYRMSRARQASPRISAMRSALAVTYRTAGWGEKP